MPNLYGCHLNSLKCSAKPSSSDLWLSPRLHKFSPLLHHLVFLSRLSSLSSCSPLPFSSVNGPRIPRSSLLGIIGLIFCNPPKPVGFVFRRLSPPPRCRLNKVCFSLHSKLRPNTCARSMTLVITIVVAIMLACAGVHFIYGGSGAQEAYPLDSQYSQFTLASMTYDARIWNLKMYVRHSQCSSVREILIIWNKGIPPKVTDFDSAVPIRIRVESRNSLNNWFSPDPLIKTRAVLELDDDIIMPCYNIERGFRIWRENPDRIVGFYPRLVNGYPVEYRAEKHARKHNGYNMILTGAAFLDSQVAFERYWSDEAGAGRVLVDEFFNWEDVLMNYLYANMSSNSNTVEYVRARWVVDMSKFSNVAISKNTGARYEIRSKCLAKFGDLYGSIVSRKVEFGRRKDGWDA